MRTKLPELSTAKFPTFNPHSSSYPSAALHSSLKTFFVESSRSSVKAHIQLISLKSTVKHFSVEAHNRSRVFTVHTDYQISAEIHPLFHSTHANFTRWILSGSCDYGILLKLPLLCPGCSRAMLTYIPHHSRSRTKTCTSRTAAAHAYSMCDMWPSLLHNNVRACHWHTTNYLACWQHPMQAEMRPKLHANMKIDSYVKREQGKCVKIRIH